MKKFIAVAVLAIAALAVLVAAAHDSHMRNRIYREMRDKLRQHTPRELAHTVLSPHAEGASMMCSEKVHGEFRRQFDCLAVKHTHHDACCWQMNDGANGLLPYECCGVGWHTTKCEALINAVCATHHGDI